MFKSSTISVTSKTVPKLLFTVHGSANQPVAVDVYNNGTHTILIGGSATASCLRPLPKGTSFQFSVIGGGSLYGKLVTTSSINVIVTVGP